MALPWTIFGTLTQWYGSQFDNNFAQCAAMGSVPCTVVGTNTLTLTPQVSGLVLSAYGNYQTYYGIAVGTNTGAVTAAVAALGALNVYKDSPTGPVALTGNEIVTNNGIWLTYDSTLNTGAGGFHLVTGPAQVATGLAGPNLQVPANAASSITSILSGSATLTFGSITPGNQSIATITIAGVSVGDVVALARPATITAGIGMDAWISAASIVSIQAFNFTSASTLTPAGGVYRVTAFRSAP